MTERLERRNSRLERRNSTRPSILALVRYNH